MAIQQFTAGQTLTANAMNTLQASDYNYTRKIVTAATYTTVLEDRGQLLEFQNAGGTTITIPLNSSVAYTTGDVLEIVNGSTATVTIVGDTGVTIEATGDITSLTSEWQKCQLVKRETNNWLLTGITSVAILDAVITDADVSPSAAIAKTKIAGTAITAADTGTVTSTMIADGTIVNGDISASAAIDKTKISGTAITAADTGTVTSAMIANDTIVNADINSSAAIVDTKLATISTAGKVSNSATTATNLNTASAIVARDASGNFSASKATLATADVTTVVETANILASAATGTINIDFSTNPTVFYTGNATANWTLNVRSTSSASLDSVLTTGQIATVTFLATNGATPYRPTVFQVDGAAITPKWMGGTAPSAGNANSIDAYTLAIIKTGSSAFTMLASQTKFA